MSSEDKLVYIQEALQSAAISVVRESTINAHDLRLLLRFLSKVVEVVAQAFTNVYTTLLRLTHITLQEARSGEYKELQMDLELLVAREQYREAENICGRLHFLSSKYETDIMPIVKGITTEGWDHIFMLLTESEVGIINLVNEAIYEINFLFGKDLNEETIRKINSIAAEKAAAIKLTLDKLNNLYTSILGKSGAPGFLELIDTNRDALEQEVNVFVDRSTRYLAKEMVMGNKITLGNVTGSIVNIDSTLDQVTQTIGSANTVDDATKKQLTDMIGQLKTELEKVPPAVKEEAEAIAETAKALVEAGTKEKPNKAMVQITGEGLKKAAENIASVVPTVLTISSGILRTIFQMIGLPIP